MDACRSTRMEKGGHDVSRARSIRFALFKFERRLRRRTERRIAEFRARTTAIPGPARVVAGVVFGVALGFLVVFAFTDRQPAESPQRVVVALTDFTTGSLGDNGLDVGVAADSVIVPEDPAVRAAEERAAEKTAAEYEAEIDSGVFDDDGGVAPSPPKNFMHPPVIDAPPIDLEMPSVEHGPPETGDVAKPPRRTHVAGLPIPPRPQWLRNALRTPDIGDSPMIAVIMDDVGVNQPRSREAVRLPGPLTMAVIPYGRHLKKYVAEARRNGHEIMVHVPMEPLDPGADPGPNALLTSLGPDELLRRLRWDLDRFDGYVGISNHMGSRFTTWDEGMRLVMREMHRRGLLFVDSWTHNRSLGMPMSRRYRVPNAARDVFIDHDITEAAIRRRLAKLERIARRRGYAVGIAHPHALSMQILREWIASVQSRGFRLVPISAVVRYRMSQH